MYGKKSRLTMLLHVVTLLALLGFGYVKGHLTGTGAWSTALKTAVVGGLAASAAFIIAKIVS